MLTLRFPRPVLLLAAALAAPAAVSAAAAPPPPARAPEFHVPVPETRTLPNGLRVVVFARHGLPLVQMQMLLPAGVAQEPADRPGVATAAAELLRAGTSSRTAASYAADVDRLGGNVNASASRDFSTVSGTFLAADFDAGLELLADVTVNPIFPEDEIARFRTRSAGLLYRLRHDPVALADAQLWTWTFAGHPYGRPLLGTLESLAGLDGNAVRTFHREHYRPDRAVLVVAGDVDPEHAFAAAADRFGAWAGHAVESPPAGDVPAPSAAPRIRIVDMPGLERSEVRAGFAAPGRANADFLPLQLTNFILGAGGFSSRLTQSLRVDGGLSYDVRSGYTALREAGLVSLGVSVQSDSVPALVARLNDVVRRLAAEPPAETELAAARRYFQNGYPLQFETLGALIAQWSAADFFGLPPGALDRYAADIGAVTAAQVGEATRRWLDPKRMTVVVVGPAAKLQGPLAAFGEVEVVQPDAEERALQPPAYQPPTPEQLERGRRLLGEMLAAHGGLAALRRVKDSIVSGELSLRAGGNELTVSVEVARKDPWKMGFSMRVPSVHTGQTLDGRRGWLYSYIGDSLAVADADSGGVEAMRASFSGDIVHTLLAAADPAAVPAWRGSGAAAGRDAELLEVTLPAAVTGAGAERRLYYLDTKDRKLIAVEQGETPGRPGAYVVRRVFRDYRIVQGVQWPFHEERYVSGTLTTTLLLQSVTLNRGLSDRVFTRPASAPREGPRR